MKISEKAEYVARHIEGISRHVDTDAAVRKAQLDKVIELIHAEKEWIDDQIAAEIENL